MALLIKGVKLSQLAVSRAPAPLYTAIRHRKFMKYLLKYSFLKEL